MLSHFNQIFFCPLPFSFLHICELKVNSNNVTFNLALGVLGFWWFPSPDQVSSIFSYIHWILCKSLWDFYNTMQFVFQNIRTVLEGIWVLNDITKKAHGIVWLRFWEAPSFSVGTYILFLPRMSFLLPFRKHLLIL